MKPLLLAMAFMIALWLNESSTERHPTKGSLAAETGAEIWTSPILVSRLDEPLANLSNRFRVNSQFRTTASRQIRQIKMRRPANLFATLPPSFSFSLYLSAIIPNLIAGDGKFSQVTLAGSVFNAKSVGEYHGKNHSRFREIFKHPMGERG